MKTFIDHFNGRNVPVIPPLLIDGKLLSDFKEEASAY